MARSCSEPVLSVAAPVGLVAVAAVAVVPVIPLALVAVAAVRVAVALALREACVVAGTVPLLEKPAERNAFIQKIERLRIRFFLSVRFNSEYGTVEKCFQIQGVTDRMSRAPLHWKTVI